MDIEALNAQRGDKDMSPTAVIVFDDWPNRPSVPGPCGRYVACPMTNTDHITVPDGVEVINVAGAPGMEDATATAEHTIRLILMALAHGCTRNDGPRKELRQCRVAIWGMGRIGKTVARYLVGLGATVDADRTAADIVTIHLPSTPETRHICDGTQMCCWKSGTILVNTSRPELVYEHALLDLLDDGQISCYATDFALSEDHPNIITTPHIGGWGQHSLQVACRCMWERLKARLDIK